MCLAVVVAKHVPARRALRVGVGVRQFSNHFGNGPERNRRSGASPSAAAAGTLNAAAEDAGLRAGGTTHGSTGARPGTALYLTTLRGQPDFLQRERHHGGRDPDLFELATYLLILRACVAESEISRSSLFLKRFRACLCSWNRGFEVPAVFKAFRDGRRSAADRTRQAVQDALPSGAVGVPSRASR